MTTPIQKYMVLSFGYKDLVGITGVNGLKRVENQLKGYNLYAVLEVCAKISTTLLNHGMGNPLGQANLLAGIFPDKTQRLKYYEKARAQAAGAPWAIFNQQSVLTLVKMAFIHCDIEKGKGVTPQDIEQVGYWLLHINDACFEKESGEKILLPSREHERERLRKAMARYQFFHASERLGYKMARYLWFIDYFEKNKPHDVDIEVLFKESTNGVSLKDYTTVCFALLVKWINISTKKGNISQDWITCKETYFQHTQLEKTNIDKVLDILAMLPQEFDAMYKESVDVVLGGHEEFHYNFMPFAWKPLVWFQDKMCFICSSSEYLFDKATEGIYRNIENYLRKEGRSKDRDTFAIAWGDAFEQYINTSLKHTFGKHFHPNIKDSKTGEEQLDGLLDSANFLFMFETKSLHWAYKTTVTGEIELAEISLKQLFKEKGLAQIARCIRKTKKGEWKLPVDSKNKTIIPVLVVSETMPQDTYNRKLYENIAEDNKSIVHDSSVLPFIIITVEEIEILEAIAKSKGADEAIHILAEYAHMYMQKNEIDLTPESIGLKNWLYYRNYEDPNSATNNKRLLSIFNTGMDQVCLEAFGTHLRKRSKKKAK